MSIFGELETIFSDYIYPVWPLFLVLALVGAAAAGAVAYRLGWHHIALRHRIVTAIAVVALLAVTIPTGYYTISPLFERNTVCEASPIAGAGAGSESCEAEANTVSAAVDDDGDGGDAPVEPETPGRDDAPPDDPDAPAEANPPATADASQNDADSPAEPDPPATAEPTAPNADAPAETGLPSADDPDTPSEATPAATPDASPFQAHIVEQGQFEGADSFHFGEGTALLIETAPGVYTLRFEDFSVRNGPDLFVYLSPDPDGYADGALELGGLKGTDGAFNYEVPAGTDVSQFQSAVVWCKAFSVLFATASFG